jgi:hypothetical protein
MFKTKRKLKSGEAGHMRHDHIHKGKTGHMERNRQLSHILWRQDRYELALKHEEKEKVPGLSNWAGAGVSYWYDKDGGGEKTRWKNEQKKLWKLCFVCVNSEVFITIQNFRNKDNCSVMLGTICNVLYMFLSWCLEVI